jgi:hypothetical protein
MFRKVLLACSNAELREFLFNAITDLSDEERWGQSEIDEVRDAATAASKVREAYGPGEEIEQKFDLAVVELHLLAERRIARDLSQHAGLKLLQELHEVGLTLPSVLLVDKVDTWILKASQTLPACELLVPDDDLASQLEATLDRLSRLTGKAPPDAAGATPSAKEGPSTGQPIGARTNRVESARTYGPSLVPESVATIEIDLPFGRPATYKISGRRGTQELKIDTQVLNIEWNELDTVVEVSRTLHQTSEHWEKYLRLAGERLSDIFDRGQFARDFNITRGWCGDSLNNVHIRFNITRELHSVAFEALYDSSEPREGYGYLMLRAPVVRRAHGFHHSRQLRLERDRPVSILVIEANVGRVEQLSGPDDPDLEKYFWDNTLEDLNNTTQELNYFKKLSARSKKDSCLRQAINKITVLSGKAAARGGNFAKAIERELTGKAALTYDIVHFAGHSIFVQDSHGGDSRGFLILPGDPHPEALPIGTFADWLGAAGTQFVYLSSCRSSEADAAFELAGNGVPAVVGFRWDLDDDRAAEYAREFYEQLLIACPAFDEAFLRTRRLMYNRYRRNDRIWAAPILMLQPQEWHRYCKINGGEI